MEHRNALLNSYTVEENNENENRRRPLGYNIIVGVSEASELGRQL